ncbi:MAG: hypothetical protein WBA12_07310, partial [Catalinimonas sp.]
VAPKPVAPEPELDEPTSVEEITAPPPPESEATEAAAYTPEPEAPEPAPPVVNTTQSPSTDAVRLNPPTPAAPAAPRIAADDERTEEEEAFEQNTLNARFSREQVTLNDRLKSSRVVALRSAIPLNQKYMFINGLFKGNNADWNAVLRELEESLTWADAEQIIDARGERYGWATGDEKVGSLKALVRRKFE